MIMSKRVVRPPAYDCGVETNRLRIVFNAQRIIRAHVANMLLVCTSACAACDA
jgi:hypothetical protein